MPPAATQVHAAGITAWADYTGNAKRCELLFPEDNRIRVSGASVTDAVRLSGLAPPQDANDATSKAYVDAAIQGLTFKKPVRIGLLTAVSLDALVAGASVDPHTIDGQTIDVVLVPGDRILLMGQTAGGENGIWEVAASGPPVRPLDFGGGAETYHASGNYVFVDQGTLRDRAYVCITDRGGDVVGVAAALEWVQFSARQTAMAGFGLAVGSATELDVDPTVIPWLAAPENVFTGVQRAPRVTGLDTATIAAPSDAVNLQYLTDTLRTQHLTAPYKDPVRLAVAHAVLPSPAAALVAGATVRANDGESRVLVAGDRVLLAGQPSAAENGVWVVGAAAAARADDVAAGATLAAGTCIPDAAGNLYVVARTAVVGDGTDGLQLIAHHGADPRPVAFVIPTALGTPSALLVAGADGLLTLPVTGETARVGDRVLVVAGGDDATVWIVAPAGSAAGVAADARAVRPDALVAVADGRLFRCRYVDGGAREWERVDGRARDPVRVAYLHPVADPALTLIAGFDGLAADDRVLLLAQTDPVQCGVWTVGAADGAGLRARDMLPGTTVEVGTTIVVAADGRTCVFRGISAPNGTPFAAVVGADDLSAWSVHADLPRAPVRAILDAYVSDPATTLVCDPATGALSLYGLSLTPGDRVLLVAQVDADDNAVWRVAAAGGTAVRTADVTPAHRDGAIVADASGRSAACTVRSGVPTWALDRYATSVRYIFERAIPSPATALVCGAGGALTLHGVTLVPGDRVLLTAQADGAENVVWIVAAAGRPVGRVARLSPAGLVGATLADVAGRSAVCVTGSDGTIVEWRFVRGAGAREPVRRAVTFHVPLPAAALIDGAILADGDVLGAGDRLLLLGQDDRAQNGIWTVGVSAARRPDDMAPGTAVPAGTVIADHAGALYVVTVGGTVDADGIYACAQHHRGARPPVDHVVEYPIVDPSGSLAAGSDGTLVLPASGRTARVGDRVLLTAPYDAAHAEVWIVAPQNAPALLAPDAHASRAGDVLETRDGRRYVFEGPGRWTDCGHYVRAPVARAYHHAIGDPSATLVDGFDGLAAGARVLLLAQGPLSDNGIWVVAASGGTALRAADALDGSVVVRGTTVVSAEGSVHVCRGAGPALAAQTALGDATEELWTRVSDRFVPPVRHIRWVPLLNPAQTLAAALAADGIAVVPGDRVLLTAQGDPDDNTIWRVGAAGEDAARTVELLPFAALRDGFVVPDASGQVAVCSPNAAGVLRWRRDRPVERVRRIFEETVEAPDNALVCDAGGSVSVSGVALYPGDRVLLTGQADNPLENAVWTVAAAGDAPYRHSLAGTEDLDGAVVADAGGRLAVCRAYADGPQWTPVDRIRPVRYVFDESVSDPYQALACDAVTGTAVVLGATVQPWDRVHLVGQADPLENGTWVAAAAGAPVRRVPAAPAHAERLAGTLVVAATGRTLVAVFDAAVPPAGRIRWVDCGGAGGASVVKAPVAAATTTALADLAADLRAGATLDGVALVAGQRVLVKDQTTDATQNGVWIVGSADAAPIRATDLASGALFVGAVVLVIGGARQRMTRWMARGADATVKTGSADMWWDFLSHEQPVQHAPVAAASTADVTDLAATLRAGVAVDGVSLAAGDRVLLKAQTNATENGVWIVGAPAGATGGPAYPDPVRAADFAAGAPCSGHAVWVAAGAENANTLWTCTNAAADAIVGASALAFAPILNHDIVPWLHRTNAFTQANSFAATTTFSGAVSVTNATAATSQTSGAVVVAGGVGVAGDVYCRSTYNLSDERLKKDFAPLEAYALDVVDALRGYEFTWRGEGEGDAALVASNTAAGRSGRSVGVKAQEVEAAGAALCVARDAQGILAVDYTKLVPYLIESVRTLKRRLDAVEGRRHRSKRHRH